jgi:glycosyltransferase involved in cell wall biosynthesis
VPQDTGFTGRPLATTVPSQVFTRCGTPLNYRCKRFAKREVNVNAEPLVSTIIPTFNRASLLRNAIDSVQQQTYRNVEIIVVDDGSTDGTQAALKAYGESVRVIVQDNAGPAIARNRGIEAAGGDIVAFLDSDDVWRRTKLERQVRLLQRVGDSVPCCLCNATMVSSGGDEEPTFHYSDLTPSLDEGVWENVAEVLATRFVLFTQTIAIRRTVLERIGGFDETLPFLEDYELPLRLSLEGPWGFISEPLVVYRRDSPGSYAGVAHANEVRLRECGVQMRRSAWERVKRSARHQHLRRQFFTELVLSRIVLRATQWSRETSWPAATLGCSFIRLDRYRRALYRRSPWYPRMKVIAIDGSSESRMPAGARSVCAAADEVK